MKVLLFLFPSLLTISLAEKLVKIEGTSGEISDIVVDTEDRWYIVKDKTLYSSFDKGLTLDKIELPSKEFVHTGLGIDLFDNIYVQDYNLTVFIVAPTVDNTFVFQEITLAYGKERLVGRPLSKYISNTVYIATKSGLMRLENGEIICNPIISPPVVRSEITGMVNYYLSLYTQGIIYSGGNRRYWIYKKETLSETPLCQTKSSVKYMNEGHSHIFFIVNGEKIVRILQNARKPTILEGIDASNINNQTDFVTYYRYGSYDTKVYVFGNINNSGTIYELGERKVNRESIIEVMSTLKLNGVRLICSVRVGNEIFFGTSNGVYQLTDLTPMIEV